MKQEKMGMGDSTTKLTTDQVSQVYDTVNNFTSTEFGVGNAFPSIKPNKKWASINNLLIPISHPREIWHQKKGGTKKGEIKEAGEGGKGEEEMEYDELFAYRPEG